MNRTDVNAPARTRRSNVTSARRRLRAAVGVLLAAALAGAGYAVFSGGTGQGPAQPGTSPSGTPSSSHSTPPPPKPVRLPVGTIGRYAVARTSLTMTEPSAVGPRVLQVAVRYPVKPPRPAGAAPLATDLFPLLVFAPGYLQCDYSYGSLLRAWASAGYVVAAVRFPVTNCQTQGPESDLVRQPRDMAFTIKRLLEVNGQQGGPLSGLIDPAQIAAAGQSDGGDTVAALVGNTCCRDHKVAAALILSGGEWPAMRGSWFPAGTVPILFVQGSADPVNPPSASLQMYRADTGKRFYLDIDGAGHLPPYEGNGSLEQLVARVTTAFLNRYVLGQRAATAAMRKFGNVGGVAQLVQGGQPPG